MNMRAISVFAAAMVAAAVGAVERTYVGTDGMWSTAANWSPSGVPEVGDTATIPAGELVEVTGADVATAAACGEIVIESGAKLKVGADDVIGKLVKLCRRDIPAKNLKGFMMSPWASCDTEANTQKNIKGIDLFADALKA